MLFNKKKNFFEKLTGTMKMREPEFEAEEDTPEEKISRTLRPKTAGGKPTKAEEHWQEEPEEEGQLTVDVYQTPTEIIVKTMVAGVRPEDLSINISRDMITIRGKREEAKNITEDNYFIKELYWGSFSRTVLLPQEVEIEDAEAIEKHGLLEIHLPKIDKEKQTNLRVKSL
jgi:HSP20 family protein